MDRPKKIEVKWEAEDGYAGASRPQKTKIDCSEIAACENAQEVRDLVYECIEDDFRQKITACYDENVADEAVAYWQQHRAESAESDGR